MAVKINDAKLVFSKLLTRRTKTTHLIIHHAAGTGSVKDIHNYHKNSVGYIGIAYNFYVRRDGTIWRGRGWEHVGGHTYNYNSISIGICFEGNYDTTKTMPPKQYSAGVALIAEALKRYPTIKTVCGHKAVNSTACPGKHFPLSKMIAEGKAAAGTPAKKPVAKGKQTVKDLQAALNSAYKAGLKIDGVPGAKTKAAIKAHPLKIGSKGAYVKWVQKRLIKLGYSCGKDGADGIFGTATLAAVKKLQKAKGLVVDGIVGINTVLALI